LKASHKPHTQRVGFQDVELVPGQFVFGRKKAADETGMSEQNIRTCLDYLRRSKNLTSKSTNKFTVITVVNWEDYQGWQDGTNQQTNQQLTNNQPTTNQPLTTNNNDKNDKNKDIIYSKEIIEAVNFYFTTLDAGQQKRFEKNRGKYHATAALLIKKGYASQDLLTAVRFARLDSFWGPNFLSFSKLNQKNPAGELYIEVFLEKAKKKNKAAPLWVDVGGSQESPGETDADPEAERQNKRRGRLKEIAGMKKIGLSGSDTSLLCNYIDIPTKEQLSAAEKIMEKVLGKLDRPTAAQCKSWFRGLLEDTPG